MEKRSLILGRTAVWLALALVVSTLAATGCDGSGMGSEQAPPSSPTATPTPSTPPAATTSPTPSLASDEPPSSPTPRPTKAEVSSPSPSPTDPADSPTTAAPRATATALPDPVATLNPEGRVGLGIYKPGMPYDDFESVLRFERLVDHKMRYALWFHAWGDSDAGFPSASVKLASRLGLIPVLTWEPWKRDFANAAEPQPAYSLASISAGEHDPYIRSWARAARAVGVPIVLRFAHEQSTEPGERLWYPWQGQPEEYRAAFRHIVTLFQEEGASNVETLWSAMWLSGSAPQYYPGDDVVDWVGTTTLNHGTAPAVEWAAWRTFDDLFAAQYDAALQWDKPIMITELATAEQGGDKATWLRDCFTSLEEKYPQVGAVLLLEMSPDREWTSIDWSVASSPESLNAFREAISDPYFK